MAEHGQVILFEHVTPPPRHRGSEPGLFFSQTTSLPAGRQAARVQVMLPPDLPGAAELWVELRHAKGGAAVTRRSWPVDGRLVEMADHLMLHYVVTHPARVEIRAGVTGADAAGFRMRALKIKRADRGDPADWRSTHGAPATWPLDRLRNVAIGLSGACPASCIHCPTNKPWLPVPRGQVMPDHIFDRLVQGLVDAALPVTEQFALGLFGEPMLDRQIAPRLRRLKAVAPETPIVINTTGAVLGPRQEEALHVADIVAIHIESLVPETYERIMAPLKFHRVLANIERIAGMLGPRAVLSLPVHRDNLAEMPAIEAWWRALGGGGVHHQVFSNRLSMAKAVLDLHLSPVAGACTQDLVQDLIIDWDGRILTCCSDFAKRTNLGSLATSTLPELIADRRRQLFQQMLLNRDWQRAVVCRTCLFDDPVALQDGLAQARAAAG